MAKSSIEKFIQSYLRTYRESKNRTGYEQWLRKNAADPALTLSENIGNIYAENEVNASEHSATSEALAKTGLKNSGYAKYIRESEAKSGDDRIEKAIKSYLSADAKNNKAYTKEKERLEAIEYKKIAAEEKAAQKAAEKAEAEKRKQEEAARKAAEKAAAKAEAERLKQEEAANKEAEKAAAKAEAERLKQEEAAKKEAEKAAAKAEAERLKQEEAAKKEAEKLEEAAKKEKEENQKAYEKAMQEIYKKVEAELKASEIADYDKAYSYGIGMGLTEADASHLAKTYTEKARNSKINTVANAIISKKLTMKQAKAYALTLGLSEADANLLAEFAYKANESVSDILTDTNYLDYLREQVNKNK